MTSSTTTTSPTQQTQEQQMETEICPICCDTVMTTGDKIYSLNCPTRSCKFNMCFNCIVSMQKSSRDSYQEASDGSLQLKVKLTCPQCRSKYEIPNNKNKYPSEIIVESVLVLRETHSMTSLLKQSDSNLNASDLAHKDQFVKTKSIEMIEDSVRRLRVYYKEIGIADTAVVKEPDYEFLKHQLPQTISSCSEGISKSKSCDSHENKPIWKDPTLFIGLDELMTYDEQEFVTQLLTSGKVELLLQATIILHGMLYINRRDTVESTVQQLSNFTSSNGGNTTNNNNTNSTSSRRRPPPKTMATIELHRRIKARYPLPSRMPLAISLPIYHPEHDKKQLLNFTSTKKKSNDSSETSELILKSVRGPAGQLGLRKGDIVTHVNVEPVSTIQQFNKAMIEEANSANNNAGADSASPPTVLVVVNADDTIAKQLKERCIKMQNDNVKL